MPDVRGRFSAVCLACVTALLSLSCQAQDSPRTKDENAAAGLPDPAIPDNATAATLESIVARAKQVDPTRLDFEQYQMMQTAIRDASKRLLKLMKGNERSWRYKEAELDVITSSVNLMANAGEEARKKTVEQVQTFLKSREQLSLQDVQTGFVAAQMFELQPFKKPARDTYQLLDDLLKDDPRDDMQSFRINLQAAVRRLDLLGNPLELRAQSIEGRPIRIEQYAGKFVLLSFFDTRYEVRETSRIKRYYEKYHSKGLEVVGIGLDPEPQTIRRFVASQEITWPIIHDNDPNPLMQLRLKFGISKFPSAFLLNKEGTVVSLEAHGSELDRLMQMLFETPTRAAPPPTAAPAENTETPVTPR